MFELLLEPLLMSSALREDEDTLRALSLVSKRVRGMVVPLLFQLWYRPPRTAVVVPPPVVGVHLVHPTPMPRGVTFEVAFDRRSRSAVYTDSAGMMCVYDSTGMPDAPLRKRVMHRVPFTEARAFPTRIAPARTNLVMRACYPEGDDLFHQQESRFVVVRCWEEEGPVRKLDLVLTPNFKRLVPVFGADFAPTGTLNWTRCVLLNNNTLSVCLGWDSGTFAHVRVDHATSCTTYLLAGDGGSSRAPVVFQTRGGARSFLAAYVHEEDAALSVLNLNTHSLQTFRMARAVTCITPSESPQLGETLLLRFDDAKKRRLRLLFEHSL